MSAASRLTVITFPPFELDLRAGQLRKHGTRIKLQERPFRLLCLLLQDPGATVSREDLKKELWPADTFVDFDHAISSAMNKLRAALGDSAESPRYIETVGRRGYRFMAEVQVADAAKPSLEIPSTAVKELVAASVITKKVSLDRNPLSRRLLFVFAALGTLALATLSMQWVTHPVAPRVVHLEQLTNSGRAEHWGRIHTDGSRLYFSERYGSQWPLQETSVSGGDVQPVQGPFPNTRIFAFSPDYGELLIGSFVDMSGDVPLWIIPTQGGGLVRVGDVRADDAAWFPDGKRIIFSRRNQVFSVERDGSNRRLLFSVDGDAEDFAWSPDGRTLRFTFIDRKNDRYIWETSADGGNPHAFFPGWTGGQPECCGAWMPDGRNFVFTAGDDIWVLRRSGALSWLRSRPVRLTAGPNRFGNPVPSRDGKRLFVFGIDQRIRDVRFDQQERDFVPFLSSLSAINLAFSRDGQWVAYIRMPGITLWRSKVDGSETVQLTSATMRALRPRWSHDGKQILFMGQNPNSVRTAYIVPAAGGTPVPVLANDQNYREFADWSPDGESVIVDNFEEQTPQAPVVSVNLKTHEVSEIVGSQGKWWVRWSPDGRYLSALSKDAKNLFLFDSHSQRWRQVATARRISRYDWGPDSRYLYLQDILDPGQSVFRLSTEDGAVERVLDFSRPLRAGARRGSFEGLAPDGSFLGSIDISWANIYALDVDLP